MIGNFGASRGAAVSGGCLLAISSYAATSLNDTVVQVAAQRLGSQVTDAVIVAQGIASDPAFLQQLRSLDRADAEEREQWSALERLQSVDGALLSAAQDADDELDDAADAAQAATDAATASPSAESQTAAQDARAER